MEEVLKRYYKGETTLAEERELRSAWQRGELPGEPILTFTTTPRPGIQLSDNLKKERFENALRVLGNALEDEKTPVQRVLYEDHNLIIAIE